MACLATAALVPCGCRSVAQEGPRATQDPALREDLARLLSDLNDGDINVRDAAGARLLDSWDQDELTKALRQEMTRAQEAGNFEVRERCAELLDRIAIRQALGPDFDRWCHEADEASVVEFFHGCALHHCWGGLDDDAMGRLARRLVGTLRDDGHKWTVIHYAHEVLAPALVLFLDDPNPAIRREALRQLGAVASERHREEIAPAVVPFLRDSDPWVRLDALQALCRLRARGHLKAHEAEVFALLEDRTPRLYYPFHSPFDEPEAQKIGEVRGEAATALAKLGDAGYAPKIAELLSDEGLAPQAAEALAELGAKDYAKHILERILLEKCLSFIGKLGTKDVIKDIAPLLKRQDRDQVAYAVRALGQLGARDHAAEIAALLKREDPYLPACAVLALAELGARDHAAEIAALLRHYTPVTDHYGGWVKMCLIESLARLGAKEYANDIVQVLRTDQLAGVTAQGIRALGDLGARQHAAEIARFLDQDAQTEAVAAIEALVTLDAREYVDKLSKFLIDNSVVSHYPRLVEVQDLTAQALDRWGIDESRREEMVAALLRDPQPGIRIGAARKLADLRAKRRVKEIAGLLQDLDNDVQCEALEALDRLNAREFARDIAALLDHPGRCYALKRWWWSGEWTTVGERAARVLDGWGLKSQQVGPTGPKR